MRVMKSYVTWLKISKCGSIKIVFYPDRNHFECYDCFYITTNGNFNKLCKLKQNSYYNNIEKKTGWCGMEGKILVGLARTINGIQTL